MFIDILPELPPDDGEAVLSFYVDCDTAFALDGGYLPADYAPDGIHLNADCLLKWKDYLLSHTVTP